MAYKPRIKLIITTPDSTSVSEVKAPNVTDEMFDAAWDLVYTFMTGKRRAPKPRYKKHREKNERTAQKKPKRVARKKRGSGNADPIGLHSMVENNREDDQT